MPCSLRRLGAGVDDNRAALFPRFAATAVHIAGPLHLHRWLPGIGLHLGPIAAYPRVPKAVGLRVVVEVKLVAVQQRGQPDVLHRVTPRAGHAARHGSHAGYRER